MDNVKNDIPEFRSLPESETIAGLDREIRAATPGASDADVADKVAALRASGLVVGSEDTSDLYVVQKGTPRRIADALADLKPEPAPKKETWTDKKARVLATHAAGGYVGPATADQKAKDAETAAYMAERRKQRPERGGMKLNRG
jgi:hypothetical protein